MSPAEAGAALGPRRPGLGASAGLLVSTAPQVTAIPGRGVGMDAVRTHVDRAGGQVAARERRRARHDDPALDILPPTLAMTSLRCLVRANGQRFAIPQVSLLELVHLDEAGLGGQGHPAGALGAGLRGPPRPVLCSRAGAGRAAPAARRRAASGGGGQHRGCFRRRSRCGWSWTRSTTPRRSSSSRCTASSSG